MKAEQEPPQELCVKLRAAADRLLAGTPMHRPGKLTILDLAEEAQFKRWLLTRKCPNILIQVSGGVQGRPARFLPDPLSRADADRPA